MIARIPSPCRSVRARRNVIGTAVLGFGLYEVAIALFIAIAPHAFFDSLGPYGHYNRHYLHDVAKGRQPLPIDRATVARDTIGRAIRRPLTIVIAAAVPIEPSTPIPIRSSAARTSASTRSAGMPMPMLHPL